MIDTATANNVRYIDLNAHLRALYTAEGNTEETYKHYYSTNPVDGGGTTFDATHLSETGAYYCANWLIQQFESMGFPFA